MATKTFEELKQMAIQIRDEKTNKQNTATRIGTQMVEHLNKLEQEYYDKTTLDKRVTELNISELFPTQGIGGTNKYDLTGAISQVDSKYRSIQGLKVSFVNENDDTECWEYKGGVWETDSFFEVGSKKLNLLNGIDWTESKYVNANGDLIDNNSAKVSDFISIEEYDNIYLDAKLEFPIIGTLYNAEKTALKGLSGSNQAVSNKEIDVKGYYFLRLNVSKSDDIIALRPINNPKAITNEDFYIPPSQIGGMNKDASNAKDGSILFKKLESSNIHDNFNNLLSVTSWTDGYYINNKGEAVQQNNVSYSDYIEIDCEKLYGWVGIPYTQLLTYFDKNKKPLLSEVLVSSVSIRKLLKPCKNAAFVIINVATANKNNVALYGEKDFYFSEKPYYFDKMYQQFVETIDKNNHIDLDVSDKLYIGTVNKSTFIGATNFVITELLKNKPSAKFMFIGQHTLSNAGREDIYIPVVETQRKLAEFWGVPFIDLSNMVGARCVNTSEGLVETQFTWFDPDKTHPGTRDDYASVDIIASMLAVEISKWFKNPAEKKIAWFGTSIPAGFNKTSDNKNQYPLIIGEILGCTVFNYSLSSSIIRLTKQDGSEINNSQSLSFLSDTCSQNLNKDIIQKIGTEEEPDLYVFDFGINDFNADNSDFNNVGYLDGTFAEPIKKSKIKYPYIYKDKIYEENDIFYIGLVNGRLQGDKTFENNTYFLKKLNNTDIYR